MGFHIRLQSFDVAAEGDAVGSGLEAGEAVAAANEEIVGDDAIGLFCDDGWPLSFTDPGTISIGWPAGWRQVKVKAVRDLQDIVPARLVLLFQDRLDVCAR